MTKRILPLFWLTALLVSVCAAAPARAEGSTIASAPATVTDVMKALALLPPECWLEHVKVNCVPIAHYDRMRDAVPIVKAAVAHARDLEEAVTVSAWSAWETNFKTTLRGDGGKSVGPLQLQAHVLAPEKAVDPELSIIAWLNLKHRAEVECAKNPEDERLALIASGNCFMARRKVAHRTDAIMRALAAIQADAVLESHLQHE
jgi:hypothetical protein